MIRTRIPAHTGNYHPTRRRPIRLVVVHTGETGEGNTPAEGMGRWFQNPAARSSAHVGADTDSLCRYVPDTATAWAAPGANADGLQLELAGRAGQTAGQWADDASALILANGATQVAEWCRLYSIPARWLTDAQLRDGTTKGIVTHAQASRVFKLSDHWDPGPNFPATRFLALVRAAAPSTSTAPKPTQKETLTVRLIDLRNAHRALVKGPGIKPLQRLLRVPADGLAGPATRTALGAAQRRAGLRVDYIFGPDTAEALLAGKA